MPASELLIVHDDRDGRIMVTDSLTNQAAKALGVRIGQAAREAAQLMLEGRY